MNKLQSNDLSIVVYIQYVVGFELLEQEIEIETTILNKTQKSRPIAANRNRINIGEEFIWKVDKNRLKQCRTTNEMVKIECFTTLNICYGNVYRRKRIGHVIIKLKEFQIIGRDWDQSISVRGFKLRGTNSYYELGLILIIQEDMELENCGKYKNVIEISKNKSKFKNERQLVEPKKQDLSKNKNRSRNSTNKENRNIYKLQKEPNKMHEKNNSQFSDILNEQELHHDTSNKCQYFLNTLNIKDCKHKLPLKKEVQNEPSSIKKKNERTIKESRESSKINEYNECKFSELLLTCLKYTEKSTKIMKQIKKDLDNDNPKKYSSNSMSNSTNSSTQSENDLEIPFIMIQEIKKKLNELKQYMINRNENIKCNKTKRIQEMSNLKNTNYNLSELCDVLKKAIESGN